MVSTFPFDGYNDVVNVQIKKFFTVTLIVIGIFLVTVAAVFFLSRISAFSERPALFIALVSGGIVAGLSLPVFAWLTFRPGSLEDYSAFALEEIDMNEEDLKESVGNWIYFRYKRRMEGDARFLEDEDGNVTCRVTVRKD